MLSDQLRNVSFGARVGVALIRRPDLIGTAVRQGFSLVPSQWWKRSPYLPVPRADYVEFRKVTLSGEPGAEPSVGEVMTYLDWCRSMRALPQR